KNTRKPMGYFCRIMEGRGKKMILRILSLIFSIFLGLPFSNHAKASQVNELKLKPNEVGTIHTSVGYSTVIQLSQKPLNVVLGDQSAFRIEFIGDNITIKPIRSGATSNLFIFTQNDRFNLTVKSGASNIVDYVVRIRRIFEDSKKIVSLNFYRTNSNLRLYMLKYTQKDESLFIDFSVHNLSEKIITLVPELFRVVVDQNLKPIRSLYLASTKINPKESINGSLMVSAPSLGRESIFWIGFANKKPLSFKFARPRNVKTQSEVLSAL
ncbi:MAG: TrbG/VirB9 family P-type conjugative transfer protein, partial [Bdellovibrionales bacterium]